MLDIQFIRDNPDWVAEKSKQKGYDVDINHLLELDRQRRGLIGQVEALQQQRNELSQVSQGQRPTDEQIERGRQLKEQLTGLEARLSEADKNFTAALKTVPNMPLNDVPVGVSENDNQVVKTVGEKPQFDFKPRNHWELGAMHGLIDKERAAKVAGSRFVYLKGGLVELQLAIVQFALKSLSDEQLIARLIQENNLSITPKPFTPVLPPALVNTTAYEATGRLNAEETTYKLADDDLWLNASAEHSLCNMYMDEILPEADLPIRYVGYATSFRREAGTYGKDMEGIIRMHQFDKLEMEVFSTPETGLDEHKLLIAIQEYLMQQLGLPYQVLMKCTDDIGKPNARGVDIEAWLPGQGKYRETHTADYMTDYQARSLKTRLRREDGRVELVHTNDATAFAMGRTLVAILENNQTKDARIRVPNVLQSIVGREWL